jgi:hypothetical protein
MAKLIVAIQDRFFKEMTKSQLEQHLKDPTYEYFPIKNKPNTICLDNACLTIDSTDDNYYAFEFISVEEN